MAPRPTLITIAMHEQPLRTENGGAGFRAVGVGTTNYMLNPATRRLYTDRGALLGTLLGDIEAVATDKQSALTETAERLVADLHPLARLVDGVEIGTFEQLCSVVTVNGRGSEAHALLRHVNAAAASAVEFGSAIDPVQVVYVDIRGRMHALPGTFGGLQRSEVPAPEHSATHAYYAQFGLTTGGVVGR